MTDYRAVNIPSNLIDEINREIGRSPGLGYRSHTEFVIDAIRRRLEKLIKLSLERKKHSENGP